MRISPSDGGTRGEATDLPRVAWKAELTLRFGRVADRSVVAERLHYGPLIVQKPLYPEGPGVCHTIVIHPPGGVAGGDELSLRMALDAGTHALVTTPAAGKWYKAGGSLARQDGARQDGTFTVGDGAVLEWLPLETIVFDAADATMNWHVNLAGNAAYAGWEVTCLGRRASGERFLTGFLRQAIRIFRDGAQLWGDLVAFKGSDPLMHSIVGLRGCSVFGTMVVAAGVLPTEILERCRALKPGDDAGCGVTALPEIFAARYLGHSAERAKAYFAALWTELRPWYAGRPAHRPRLWDT